MLCACVCIPESHLLRMTTAGQQTHLVRLWRLWCVTLSDRDGEGWRGGAHTDRSSRVWSPLLSSWPGRRRTTACTLLLWRETWRSRRSSSSRSSTCGASPTGGGRRDSGGRTMRTWKTTCATAGRGPASDGGATLKALPCVEVWASSPWRSQTCRVRSSECPRIWSTGWDTTGARSSGFLCSGKALSAGTRCRPHSGRSYTHTEKKT